MKLFTKVLLFASVLSGVTLFSSCGKAQEHEIAVVAHRGFWQCEAGGFARNSVASLTAACEAGFYGSEFDLNMTSDGVLLVHHDAIADGKNIQELPASEFTDCRLENDEPIPTFADYLKTAQRYPKTKLILEMKAHASKEIEDKAVETAVQQLKDFGLFSPDRVAFISFSFNICEDFVRLAPGFTVQYLDTDYTIDQIEAAGINGVDTEKKYILENPEWYADARSNKMSVNVWTIKNAEQSKAVAELGVDMITSDRPDVTRETLAEMGIKENRL